jgi:uncharacterized protein YdcH (DUF465 family)
MPLSIMVRAVRLGDNEASGQNVTATRTDERAFAAAGRHHQDVGAARDAVARWVTGGYPLLTLLLSALAADDAVASLAPSLRRDSARVLALFEETERLSLRARSAEGERERIQREVQQLRQQADRLKLEREELADKLTWAANTVLTRRRRLRIAARRSAALSA